MSNGTTNDSALAYARAADLIKSRRVSELTAALDGLDVNWRPAGSATLLGLAAIALSRDAKHAEIKSVWSDIGCLLIDRGARVDERCGTSAQSMLILRLAQIADADIALLWRSRSEALEMQKFNTGQGAPVRPSRL